MSKRFTCTELWGEDWFLDLTQNYKLLWQFIKDDCSFVGIWKPNKRKADFGIGAPVDIEDFFNIINKDKERIRKLSGGRWFIVDFIPFQYGPFLNLNNRVHKSIYTELARLDIKLNSIRGLRGVKVSGKDKDMDKDKDTTSVYRGKGQPTHIEKVVDNAIPEGGPVEL